MGLEHIDRQLVKARAVTESPELPNDVWHCLATTIYSEITSFAETATNRLRRSVPIPPERYVEELKAFEAWMTISHANADNPAIVRAQVMTELYVAFVWLRDSLMEPIAKEVTDDSAFATIERFLREGRRRNLRNAIAHGRWCYLPDFSGLECWDQPSRGTPNPRFEISQTELDAWQLLSRGTAIAALCALTDGG